MKLRLPKRQPGTSGAEAFLVEFCDVADRSIPALRTTLLLGGLVSAAASTTGRSADLLFATGLVFQCVLWFESWWIGRQLH